MNKLIAAVKARQCLWDKSYRGHCSRSKLERYWNEVAAEVGTSSVNCQKKWKNLKDQCQKEIKKNVNNSDWPHFHTLKFIHHHFLEDDIINKLIDLVQVREIIWNRQVEGHHNRYKIDESWKEIAQELNVTGVYCRKRWKYLKDQCRKEIKENANNSDWPHFHKLKFIHHHFLEDDMNKLIDLVQVREIIWNRQVEGHYNRNKLDESWKEIAQELNVTRVNCQVRWKHLIQYCRKEIKKNANNSDWPHFHKLKFIHHQLLVDDDEDGEDTNGDVFNSLDDSMKRPKLGYTMRKKLLMDKRKIDMNKLIDLVQVREIIWNKQLEDHHNRYKVHECWMEIAQELNVTGLKARLKWKYLRDHATKEVRKQKSKWKFLPKLQFYTNQFKDYEGNENQELELKEEHFQEEDHFEIEEHFEDAPPEPSAEYFNIEEPKIAIVDTVSIKDDEFDKFVCDLIII